jgi:signal transduction histidine kinase
MKTTTVYLVRLPQSVREACASAVRRVLPRARVVQLPSVNAALRDPANGRQLLVLGEATEAECGLAAQATDLGELPRWAVVHLDENPSDLIETVPPADWNAGELGRTFRAVLLQHDLLRENLRLRGDLKTIARRITHDARTPLGCILTVCEAIKDADATASHGLSPAEARRAIQSSAHEIALLLDRVSFVLRASVDPQPASRLNMGTVVNQLLVQLRPEIEAAGQKIRLPAKWPEVEGVPGWLEFIWTQLIQNAVRHGAHSGSFQLGWDAHESAVHFWIASPGMLLPGQETRIWRPFHLLHQQTQAGLGLSLVQRLVELQGGQCAYKATNDSRAVFGFTLPAAGEEEPRQPATKNRQAAEGLAM